MIELHELARTLFEATENERSTRGDFTTRNPDSNVDTGGRPRRWTELPILEQDLWIAAARAAMRVMLLEVERIAAEMPVVQR
jgi:hypothetical protein